MSHEQKKLTHTIYDDKLLNPLPIAETTKANVLTEDISIDPPNKSAEDSLAESVENKDVDMDLQQMPRLSDSMSNMDIGRKSASMMSIDDAPFLRSGTRRKSTLILTEEAENALDAARKEHDRKSKPKADSRSAESHSKMQEPKLYLIEIKWIQGGSKVYVTGSFTGWTKMIKMKKLNDSDKEFVIRLNLPVGTHRFRFVVDNELRFSDYLPTATDSRGNFVNYIEILAEDDEALLQQQRHEASSKDDAAALDKLQQIQESQQLLQKNLTPEQRAKLELRRGSKKDTRKDSHIGLTQDDDDMGNGYSRFHEKSMIINAKAVKKQQDTEYTANIPAIFTDPQAMERYYLTLDQQNRQNGNNNGNQWLIPPALPPHLDHVILNNQQQVNQEGGFNKEINAGGSLPIPNHVILNHLATTSIKHNTLAVATTVRYKRKYLTQILYAPLQ